MLFIRTVAGGDRAGLRRLRERKLLSVFLLRFEKNLGWEEGEVGHALEEARGSKIEEFSFGEGEVGLS